MEFILFGTKLIVCLLTFLGSLVCGRIGGTYSGSVIGMLFDFSPYDRSAFRVAFTSVGGFLGAFVVIDNLHREYIDLSGSVEHLCFALACSFAIPLAVGAAACSIKLACKLADAVTSLPSLLVSWAELLFLNCIKRFMQEDIRAGEALRSTGLCAEAWQAEDGLSPVARLLLSRHQKG